MESLDKAKQLNPKLPEVYYNLGICYYYRNEFKNALNECNMAIKFDSGYFWAYINGASCCRELGMNVTAIDYYTKALSLNPKYADGYEGRADVYFDLNKSDKARKDYTMAIKLNNRTADNYYYRAMTDLVPVKRKIAVGY